MWGFGDLIDSLDGLSSVVDGGLVHMTNLAESVGNAGEGNHQTHYWALRQQARAPFWGWLCVGRVGVLLPRFGGGVWCLIRG